MLFTNRCHVAESAVCEQLAKAGWHAGQYHKALHPSGHYVAKTYANAAEQIGVWHRQKLDGAVLLIPITMGPAAITERISRFVAEAAP